MSTQLNKCYLSGKLPSWVFPPEFKQEGFHLLVHFSVPTSTLSDDVCASV